MVADIQQIQHFTTAITANLEKVIVGKRPVLDLVVMGLLCQSHILIEDIPGVGKTMLARSLSKSLGCRFSRLQFTSDMLPSDVTGVSIYNQNTRQFEYRPGPVMSQIVLVDEINRATPKTQAALLEAMEERQVTVDGVTYPLPHPFMVIATQNPIEYEGTFPLPEAQLDRFMLQIRLGYPSFKDEVLVLENQQLRHPIEDLQSVVSTEEVITNQEEVKKVFVSKAVKQYIVEICRATRNHSDVHLGASPRGSLALFKLGQAHAALEGRDFVLPDDVQVVAPFALPHRLMLQAAARLRNLAATQVVEEILKTIPVPGHDLEPEK